MVHDIGDDSDGSPRIRGRFLNGIKEDVILQVGSGEETRFFLSRFRPEILFYGI